MGDTPGHLWLGAFVGFIVIVILGWMFPVIGHLAGGLVAGLIARAIGRGALAGFLAGIFGGIIITILTVIFTTHRRNVGWSPRRGPKGEAGRCK